MAARDSRSRDDSGEPADPSTVEVEVRRSTRLAAPSLKVDRLPAPLVECGCGDCPNTVDPLADNSGDGSPTYAANACPDPRPMTVERAADAYLQYDRAAVNSDTRTSLHEHALTTYGRLLEADRRLRDTYDALTTVLVTRRLSPLADDGMWTPPLALDERLHGGDVAQSITDALRYHLRDYTFEYIAVTATTDSAATPHEHILVYVDDPDNDVDVTHFEPALDKHVQQVTGAYVDDHPVTDDGSKGAITVQHDPQLVDDPPDALNRIRDESPTAHDGCLDVGESTAVPANTAAAQYLASQLPALALADVYDNAHNVEQTTIDGAAIAWAVTHHWLRSSQGITLR